MYKGWTRRGKPFTKDEYLNSYLYKNTRRSYDVYLMYYSKLKMKARKLEKKTPKPLKNTEPKTPK